MTCLLKVLPRYFNWVKIWTLILVSRMLDLSFKVTIGRIRQHNCIQSFKKY
uniref:Uncharacterized protein n=1 Tax=Anguilla anguilla TaxID=7936 RepID=A0A0E9WB89_ANGAN